MLSSKITGGKIIYNKLLQYGVSDTFLYSGGAIMPLIDQFYNQNKIKYYIHTHEQNLGHAATGYARSTGKVGICIVTSGPGLTNMITPMLDAQNDSTPLIVFSGQVPLTAIGTNAFQEAPSVEITKPFTKMSKICTDTEELNDIIDHAFYLATDGKKGVVHIDLPKCVISNKIDETTINKDNKVIHYFTNKIKRNGSDINYDIISNIINNSKQPVIYAGQGVNDASKELTEFVEKSNIPITTTIHGMGAYDETKPLSLKFVGMHGNYTANKAVQEADCIIALGSRFDDRTTGNIKKYAPYAVKAYNNGTGGIIHCNIKSNEYNKNMNINYSIISDCKTFLSTLNKKIKYNKRTDWISYLDKLKKKYPFQTNFNLLNNKITSQDVLIELNNQLKQKNIDYIVTTGVGNHQMFAAQFIDWKKPKTFISSGSLGVMGFGLPAAIGCGIGNPSKQIINIDGDGSFLMTMPDMKTLKQHNINNVKIIVLNNNTLGMVDIWENLFFEGRITATDNKYAPNFYKVAKNFGLESSYCDSKLNLKKSINKFLNCKTNILAEFKVEHTPCYPLVAPGAALDDVIMNKSDIQNINTNVLPPS